MTQGGWLLGYRYLRLLFQDAQGNMVGRAPIEAIDLVLPPPVGKAMVAMVNLGASRAPPAPARRGSEAVDISQMPSMVCLTLGARVRGHRVQHGDHRVLGREVSYACAASLGDQPKGRDIVIARERRLDRLGGPGDGRDCVEACKSAKHADGQFVVERNRQILNHDVLRSCSGGDLNRPRLRMTVASARACAGVPSQTSFSASISSSLPATASRDTPPTASDT